MSGGPVGDSPLSADVGLLAADVLAAEPIGMTTTPGAFELELNITTVIEILQANVDNVTMGLDLCCSDDSFNITTLCCNATILEVFEVAADDPILADLYLNETTTESSTTAMDTSSDIPASMDTSSNTPTGMDSGTVATTDMGSASTVTTASPGN